MGEDVDGGEGQPEDQELRNWHRRFAVETNNMSWMLAEKTGPTEDDIEQLLRAAHTAAFHWFQVGDDVNKARADLLLAQAYAVADLGPPAFRHASRSHALLTGRDDAPDWEVALANGILANAARADGKPDLHRHHLAEARATEIADPQEAAIVEATLRVIPPAG